MKRSIFRRLREKVSAGRMRGGATVVPATSINKVHMKPQRVHRTNRCDGKTIAADHSVSNLPRDGCVQNCQNLIHLSNILAGFLMLGTVSAVAEGVLDRRFAKEVRPFLESYCLDCHDRETRKGDLDLSQFQSLDAVVKDAPRWEAVLGRLREGDMPPKKSKHQPTADGRKTIITWIETVRDREARRTAGDPGPVPARRLSNAEYDYTMRELTGVDLRPASSFPVDPANQAGFDNSGESLAMSPALVNKYLQAAREVSEHLVLQTEGFTFASHPVMTDTDRDKWAVFRIVNFYRQQPTDYADYFMAAWRFQNRRALGNRSLSLDQAAADAKVSSKYLTLLWSTLTEHLEELGPIAKLQAMWRGLPDGKAASLEEVRHHCEAMRDYVVNVRQDLVPEVKNLTAPPVQDGSQTMVMWKNRQMAANRRRFDPGALKTPNVVQVAEAPVVKPKETNAPANRPRGKTNHVQAATPDIVKKGGLSLPPAVLTKESSATARLASFKKRGLNPELIIPADPALRPKYEVAFARFADIFPDAFYITERARVFLDAEKEQENAGRLLSAGLHSMTGYFRDDGPLYDLILDDAGKKQLDRLWDEFFLAASVPQRMHSSFLWFERTDSEYMRDVEFDPYRPEDKSATSQEKIKGLATIYLAKARKNNASETAQQAIQDHFKFVAASIQRVEDQRQAAEPSHLKALEDFAARAYRRSLSTTERDDLQAFYHSLRDANGLSHEDAVRDSVVRILMSPHFAFRMDLVEAAGSGLVPGEKTQEKSTRTASAKSGNGRAETSPLSDTALASRLSYFLWAGPPDKELLTRAAAGDLHKPDVLRAQVKRLLQDDRVRQFATEFGGNWLDFRRFEQHNSVDRGRFPMFDNDLRSAMFEEPVRFFVDVAQRDRSVLDFLYGRDTFVNGTLARHYGLSPVSADTNAWVHVDNAREVGRGGLLPMSVFLTANSPGLRTSPVKRGNWVVKRILGERIPPPPATVPELPGDEKKLGDLTLREALAKHRANEACAGCHARFDSFGLVFESYGPIGERRANDLGGHVVDTHAEFPGGSQGEGLEGLMNYIHQHRENDFVDNLCRKLLAYGLGRTLILSDEPLVQEMRAKLASRHYRFSSLIESIVTSPQFLNKRDGRQLARR